MALVECRECQARVSDSCQTCPHCGVAGPAGLGKIIFSRRHVIKDSTLRLDVYVDDVPVGVLDSGGFLATDCSPGRHEFTIICRIKGWRSKGAVLVASNKPTECDISVGFLGGINVLSY